ncbi:MAG: S9 family peptidase [Planctomycetota bacterium]
MSLTFAADDIIKPGENLVADGIPPIQSSIVDTAGRYGWYRSASFVGWHPAQREMLITTRFGDTTQLHLLARSGGARQQLTFYPDAVMSGSFHPNIGDYIIFSKDTGGGEWYQLYRYDIASGYVTLLTDGKSRNHRGPWSTQGDRIAYTSTRRTNKDNDIWIMNPNDPTTDRMLIQLEGGGWSADDWSPDDKTILLTEGLSINESYLWLVDTTTGVKTALTPRDAKEKVAYSSAVFSKDGKGIYATTDKDSEFQRLTYIDLATKTHTTLSSTIPWDVTHFDLSKDGGTLAFTTNEDGLSVLHVLNTVTRKELPRPQIPAGVIGGMGLSATGKEIAFSLTNARSPGDVYSVDLTTGKLDRWTTSETAVKTDAFREAELVRWKSFDDKMISGFLYNPPAKFTGKRPVMIVIHGGPESQSQPIFLGRLNYYMNELGIACIFPNIRGSIGYGKTFSQLDNGFKREDSYKDINALFDWIATQPNLDPERICVTGGSYGGHMTLALSTFYSNRIRCSISIVGMSNLVTFLEHTEAYRRDLRRVEYGDERDPKMREFLTRIAPMNNIEKIKKPMMVIQGKNDPRVPLSESEQIVAALKKQGTPVWYLMAKDEGHGFRKKPNQDFQMYSTLEFIKEYLLK